MNIKLIVFVTYYSNNNDIDVITLYMRLSHIGQDKMNRFAKEEHFRFFI